MKKDTDPFRIDVFKHSRRTRVVAELPGFHEEDIRLDLIDDLLSIFATHGNKACYRIVTLGRNTEKIIGKVFNGSILEVTLC